MAKENLDWLFEMQSYQIKSIRIKLFEFEQNSQITKNDFLLDEFENYFERSRQGH